MVQDVKGLQSHVLGFTMLVQLQAHVPGKRRFVSLTRAVGSSGWYMPATSALIATSQSSLNMGCEQPQSTLEPMQLAPLHHLGTRFPLRNRVILALIRPEMTLFRSEICLFMT